MSEEQPLSFIASSLDDSELTAQQFRVYCKICRRAGKNGVCNESAENMIRSCKMNQKTFWSSISVLLELRMISKETRHGDTTEYRIKPVSQWLQPTPLNGSTQNRGCPLKRSATYPLKRGTHLPPKTEHKGSPSEGSPIKGGEGTP